MKLVIAEKPSVAQSLAAVIGATVRKDGYLEGNGWRVSWCVGHLAGLADADSYDPKYAKWRYDDLPILPEHWQMVVGKDKKKQFDILKKLMNAPDVTEVVNACDAGREGELIFRSVYELADCQKPMKRLWISSMEDSAIREGFANLRPGADYDGLRDAALCRAKADWLVGINATRLFSVLYFSRYDDFAFRILSFFTICQRHGVWRQNGYGFRLLRKKSGAYCSIVLSVGVNRIVCFCYSTLGVRRRYRFYDERSDYASDIYEQFIWRCKLYDASKRRSVDGSGRNAAVSDFPTACVAVSQMSGGYISWNDGNRCGKCVVF